MEINSNMSYFECIVPVWKDTKPLVAKVDLKIEGKPDQNSVVLISQLKNEYTFFVLEILLSH